MDSGLALRESCGCDSPAASPASSDDRRKIPARDDVYTLGDKMRLVCRTVTLALKGAINRFIFENFSDVDPCPSNLSLRCMGTAEAPSWGDPGSVFSQLGLPFLNLPDAERSACPTAKSDLRDNRRVRKIQPNFLLFRAFAVRTPPRLMAPAPLEACR